MTSYEAYDAGLPCKNSSCKSYGKSHPNCRCWGSMAQGGSVQSYCDKSQPHRRDCKYFKDGGEVHTEDIPKHADTNEAVSHFLSHGIHHVLKMKGESPDKDLDKYNQAVTRGGKAFDGKVDSLFGGDKVPNKDKSKAKDAIKEWVDKGGAAGDMQDELHKTFAGADEKGVQHDNHIATAYPAQNMMLQAAKGRVSNYLGGLKPRPENQPRLAFDDPPDDTKQKKTYEKAVDVAAHPLGVLDDVRDGMIDHEALHHFKSMYPELDTEMQKKLTKRITQAQLDGDKPSFGVRQSLSMLMGTPLSGELSPQNIMAAQATFQSKKPDPAQGGGQPKKTGSLTKTSQSYLLTSQALAERQQKQ